MKQLAAAAMAASMMISSGVYAIGSETEAPAESGVALSIAGSEDAGEASEETADGETTETAAETETETETEVQTEAVVYDQLETTNSDDAKITTMDVSEIVESTMPAIVSVSMKSIQEVENYFYGGTQEYEVEGAGSGIIVAQNDTELLIATNNHIVEDATEMTVCFSVDAEDPDDLVVKAVVKGTDAGNDLAVIAVKLADIDEDVFKQLKIATLGSSDDLKVGQATIVIGNALGIGQTVTTGIVSALQREITTEAGTFTELQTDAAINFGCSGGAMLNAKGEVIAITDAKATSDNAESMGYGIPIDTAIPILTELINRETREAVENHGYLGITVVPVSEEAVQMYGMPEGAYVYEVTEGSAADEAGIQKGDIITRFDGRTVTSSDDLVEILSYYNVGETMTVVLQRANGTTYEETSLEVTLQGAPASYGDDGADTGSDEKSQDPSDTDKPNGSDQEDAQPMPGGSGFGNFFGQFGDGNGLW